MKRIFQLLIIIVAIMSFPVVYAADPYTWTVGGEVLNKIGDSNASGSVQWMDSGDYTGGVLVLNNYKGSGIALECKGTSSNQAFAIELVGDSVITSDKIGIVSMDKIEFIGDGTLTIVAPVTLSSNMSGSIPTTPISITIYGKDWVNKDTLKKQGEEQTDVIEVEDVDKEVVVETVNEPKYLICIGGLVVLLLLIAFGFSKLTKK